VLVRQTPKKEVFERRKDPMKSVASYVATALA
jgi:hypothetical protein